MRLPEEQLTEFAGMELTLSQKEELHNKLIQIINRKLKETPDDPFLLESKAAEEKEWARLTAKKKSKN